ncbi:hypothetical protein PROFUN_02942 [Planoprotostelium fungivorum]|uniref:Secreted protein n=1 Tax=Planoprotostelium fungivorum TaxID=1890364 RepID=A0A2P6NX52_9EUKA|nr:hypothetical protein PROFUN_02942 [Planoprotostelium fungivorum]
MSYGLLSNLLLCALSLSYEVCWSITRTSPPPDSVLFQASYICHRFWSVSQFHLFWVQSEHVIWFFWLVSMHLDH